MPITINGSGTVTGISVGGLPDGIVDNDTIANSTIAAGKCSFSPGKILQVVQGSYNTAESTTSTSYVNTSLAATITPASSSNHIYISTQSPGWITEEPGTDCLGYYALYRSIGPSTICEAGFGLHTGDGARADVWTMQNFALLDSPSTTSACTYTVQMKVISSGYSITHCHNNRKARIVLMEVAA